MSWLTAANPEEMFEPRPVLIRKVQKGEKKANNDDEKKKIEDEKIENEKQAKNEPDCAALLAMLRTGGAKPTNATSANSTQAVLLVDGGGACEDEPQIDKDQQQQRKQQSIMDKKERTEQTRNDEEKQQQQQQVQRLQCIVCGMLVSHQGQMTRHYQCKGAGDPHFMRDATQNKTVFVPATVRCDECPLLFVTESERKSHKYRKHTSVAKKTPAFAPTANSGAQCTDTSNVDACDAGESGGGNNIKKRGAVHAASPTESVAGSRGRDPCSDTRVQVFVDTDDEKGDGDDDDDDNDDKQRAENGTGHGGVAKRARVQAESASDVFDKQIIVMPKLAQQIHRSLSKKAPSTNSPRVGKPQERSRTGGDGYVERALVHSNASSSRWAELCAAARAMPDSTAILVALHRLHDATASGDSNANLTEVCLALRRCGVINCSGLRCLSPHNFAILLQYAAKASRNNLPLLSCLEALRGTPSLSLPAAVSVNNHE